jgi:hypothetical protein
MVESSGEHLGALCELSVWETLEAFGRLEVEEASGKHLESSSQNLNTCQINCKRCV